MQKINQPWSLTTEEILKQLETQEIGLTDKEVEARLFTYGTNTFHSKEKINIVSIFLKQFLSPLIFLLIGAIIITSFLREWINTVVISFAILLNVFLGFFHEYHAENTLNKLKSYIKERARVIRDGREQEVDSSLLVPGDIIKLSYGFRVPADARILSVNNFNTDEAILTGESMPVEKNEDLASISALVTERKNIAHSGTLVVQGYATAVVYATGNDTEIGKIASIVSKIDRVQTPFKKGIDRLAWIIFYLAITIVSGILILGVLQGEDLLHMLVLSAAIAVGAVPEALPIALTIILAIGATRIASKNGIVRKLTAAETLGSTTLIMTDKTGTLTLADMQLVGVYSKHMLALSKSHQEDHKSFSHEQKKLLELALYNIDVSLENKDEDKKKWSFSGRPFEVNIAKACQAHNVPLDSVESLSSYLVLPFNSTNKFSVALHDGKYIIMGAPDILLKRSEMSKEKYLEIENWIDATSKGGKRLVALATMPEGDKKHSKKNISPDEIKDLNFLGIFVFYDPIRPEVPSAIKNIESHGVKIALVTGDLKGTAMAVAESLGWKVEEDEAITGGDINNLSDEELLAVLPKIKIFARVTPEDKLRIGKLYQQMGEVVAMTGDGVNDAPALKAMDIGISLGSGSDVAKSAADLVLLDDNFKTISMAIDEGRRILSNIRKAIVFLMSNSLDGIFVITGSFFFGLPLPITALQIIWVNLFTGSLPALAFAFDEDIDKSRNAGKDLRLIFTKEVKYLAFGVGMLTSVLLFLFYYFMVKLGIEIGIARSIFFVCFSSYVLVIAFSFRSLHFPIFSYNIFSNKKLNWSILIAVVLLIFTVTAPFMRQIFTLSPLPLYSLPIIALWLALNVMLVEGAKYVIYKKLV
jgi:Ca2+-transporting ATPase